MMSVVSVNLNGNYDEIDGIIIAGKVSSRASFGDSNITWKGDLGTLLPELLGNNSAIIMQDLKIPVDKSTYDLAMKTGDDDQDINISLSTNADDIDIRSFDFDFDPEISDPDEELGSPQGDDMGGDEDFADFMNDMDVGDEEEIDSDIEGDVEPDEENPQDEG
jgi:hypothetical protein